MDAVGFFFAPPETDPSAHRTPEGYHSVLYLLRRELQDCLFGTVVPEAQVRAHDAPEYRRYRLFATAMVLVSGLDLLGQFRAPLSSVEDRFAGFVTTYLYPGDAAAATTLYGVRNALLHTFGLHDATKQLALTIQPPAHDPAGRRAVSQAGDSWVVELGQLYDDFVRAVAAYRADLLDPDPAHEAKRRDFLAMFTKGGTILIGAI